MTTITLMDISDYSTLKLDCTCNYICISSPNNVFTLTTQILTVKNNKYIVCTISVIFHYSFCSWYIMSNKMFPYTELFTWCLNQEVHSVSHTCALQRTALLLV